MNVRRWIGSSVLLVTVLVAGGDLGAWKLHALQQPGTAAMPPPEPIETVMVARVPMRPG